MMSFKLPSYSAFLVRYHWFVIVGTLLLGAGSIITCVVIGNYPDIQEPVKVWTIWNALILEKGFHDNGS